MPGVLVRSGSRLSIVRSIRVRVKVTLTQILTLPVSKSGATIWHLFFVHPATYYYLRYDDIIHSSLLRHNFVAVQERAVFLILDLLCGDTTVGMLTLRASRIRTVPDRFVARPSKSGVGVEEGDEPYVIKNDIMDVNKKSKTESGNKKDNEGDGDNGKNLGMGMGTGTGTGTCTDMQVGNAGIQRTAARINEKGYEATVAPIRKYRKYWTAEEDSILKDRRSIHGVRWSEIASSFLPGRSGNQCQTRFLNYLVPGLKKNVAWTNEEDNSLIALHKNFGSKWTMISRHLPGRSWIDVRNHWYSKPQRQRRLVEMETVSLKIWRFDVRYNNARFESFTRFY